MARRPGDEHAVPVVQYVRSGRHHIAYQSFGSGDVDLVFTPNWATNVEIIWEQRVAAAFLRRMGTFARVVLFDRRGSGLSDPVGLDETPTLDQLVDDTLAVMDAADIGRAAMFTTGLAAGLGIYLAATHPERLSSLILYNATARSRRAPDYPCGIPEDLAERISSAVEANWGRRGQLGWVEDGDPWVLRWQRLSLSPGAAVAAQRLYRDLDLRPLLPSVRINTLVVHTAANQQLRVEHGRFLADNIPNASFAEIAGSDPTWYVEDNTALAEEVQAFLTGTRSRLDGRRAVATILFTDIVGSTERAASLGDERWNQELAQHVDDAERAIDIHRGRLVKTTGDGLVATFDSATRAIQCATALQKAAQHRGLTIRAGLHTGECEATPEGDIGGIAVHIAARAQALADGGEVVVTSTLKDLVLGSGLRFSRRGEYTLKGIPGPWTLWTVPY